MKLLYLALLSCFLLHQAQGVYFYIGEKETKCFIEELPEDIMVTGKYKAQFYDKQTKDYIDSPPGMGMHVNIKDPDSKVILDKVYGSEGAFTFTTHTPGEQHICIGSNSTRWSLFAGGKIRVHLAIQIGEQTVNYKEVAEKEKLTELQLRVRQLLDQLDQIQKEQNYQRLREGRFRQTSEATNQRVMWWAIIQVVLLLLAGYSQMHYLKKFFRDKKLV